MVKRCGPHGRRGRGIALTLSGLTSIGLLALALLAAPSAWAHPHRTRAFGSFAGYVWFGHVRSVHASWTVPRPRRGSPVGLGGTWIGAQTASAQTAFIQIGTVEVGGWPGHRRRALSRDEAFWSDAAHHYHAQRIFRVRPGERISATISLAAGRWRLSIADRSTGAKFHISTREEACASFGQAEWVQEDPRSSLGLRSVAYPTLSQVRFAHLKVDRRRPPYRSLFSSWMSLPRMALAPTPLRRGAFAIHDAGPIDRAGSRYLRIAAAEDLATERFIEKMNGWSPATPAAEITAERAKAAAAMRANIRALSRANWPQPAGRRIRRLIRASRVLRAQTKAAPQLTAPGIGRWQARWTEDAAKLGARAHRVRRALGLPELTPSQSARRRRKLLTSQVRSTPACPRR